MAVAGGYGPSQGGQIVIHSDIRATSWAASCEFEIQSNHRHLPAMSLAFDPEDFSFVVKMRGAPAKPWVWEIHRAGKSGPVERSPVCYASMAEAVREGKKALARLLMAV